MPAVILLLTALGVVLCLMGGSKAKRYKVDLCGSDFCYEGAKSSYRTGQKVVLYFTLIATDTDYSFYLDGNPISFDYDEKKGFIIRFTMPDHDVKLEHRTVNTMTYIPPQWEGKADIILLDCYRATTAAVGADGYHELVITATDDPQQVRLDEHIKKEGAEESCRSFHIPFFVAQEFLCFVDDHGLALWNDMENGISIDGAKKVCRFWDGKKHIRVSTDRMPEDGEKTLDTLFELVKSCAVDGVEE